MTNNELIGKFLGFKKTDDGWYDANDILPMCCSIHIENNTYPELLFDASWDWLITAVNYLENHCSLSISITYNNCYVVNSESTYDLDIVMDTKLQSVFMSIVKYINWYKIKDKS